jgi:hypothetical protein
MIDLPENSSHIQSFRVNGSFYGHWICTETDVVFLVSEAAQVLATYSQNATMRDAEGIKIGSFRMGARYTWYFVCHNEAETQYDGYGNDLLNAEVEISKLFIEGKLK